MIPFLGMTPEDVKVTFDHPYTEIIKVEGQPDQKVKKTVPVTLELFIPKRLKKSSGSWRSNAIHGGP